ncbi:hypothetical protein K3495_g10180 [Podosphaera aphanis]|nr:hypothetical protein K3495_g10180 [Podosphaera aphanis]
MLLPSRRTFTTGFSRQAQKMVAHQIHSRMELLTVMRSYEKVFLLVFEPGQACHSALLHINFLSDLYRDIYFIKFDCSRVSDLPGFYYYFPVPFVVLYKNNRVAQLFPNTHWAYINEWISNFWWRH